jgi:transposase InsO family protein
MGFADCLSRMPLNEEEKQTMDDELMVFVAETFACTNHEKIANATADDEQLQIVKQIIISGWPETRNELQDEAKPFWEFRDELSVYNGVLYRGQRVCIPMSLRSETMKAIHKSHLGIVNCKRRAKELVYWPGMNKQIEDVVSKCSVCLTYKNKPAKEPMIMQPVPELPWSKVGTDLFEVDGFHYLIMVDYYSNFIEVSPLQHDTRTSTIVKQMKANIARYGIMDTLVSDNGPQFSSQEFKQFVDSYNIKHVTSSPLYQQSNGLAERAVQTVKNLTKKCFETGDDIYLCLLELRNTPRDDVVGSPMQRLMGRRARTLIPISKGLRKPQADQTGKIASKMNDYRCKQKFYYDRHTKVKEDLKPNDAVRIKTPTGWRPAEYVRKSPYPRSHIVKAGESGREYRRNTSMLMKTKESPHVIETHDETIPKLPMVSRDLQQNGRELSISNRDLARNDSNLPTNNRELPREQQPVQRHSAQQRNNATEQIRTRSGRAVKTPSYLKDYVC